MFCGCHNSNNEELKTDIGDIPSTVYMPLSVGVLTGVAVSILDILAFPYVVGVGLVTASAYKMYEQFYLEYEYIAPEFPDNAPNTRPEVKEDHACYKGSKLHDTYIKVSDQSAENHLNAQNGINMLVGADGSKDYFYFSLCSTSVRVTSGIFSTQKVAEANYVKNFRDGEDKIRIFCSKNTVDKDQVRSQYSDEKNMTIIEVAVPSWREHKVPLFYERIAILVDGKHEGLLGNMSDIELNHSIENYC